MTNYELEALNWRVQCQLLGINEHAIYAKYELFTVRKNMLMQELNTHELPDDELIDLHYSAGV